MIKLVLSDIDGTLIPFGQEHASARTMAAIEAVREAGIRFGVATGRDVVELTQQFEGNTMPFETGILSNGKKIMVDGELVRLTLLNNEALRRVAELVAEYPRTFLTTYPYHTHPGNPIYCIGASPEEIAPWAEKYAFTPMMTEDVPDEEMIGATIACGPSEAMMTEIIARGQKLFPDLDFLRPAPQWTDVVPKGINKGTALTWLLDELGLHQDEIMMFGDADNDLAILRAVENAVAVENATPAAKAAAKWHIGPTEEDSVAQALERLAQGKWIV